MDTLVDHPITPKYALDVNSERYQLTKSFVLRMTGFPVETVDSLAVPELAALTDDVIAAQREALTKAQEILNSHLELGGKVRRTLKRGEPIVPGPDVIITAEVAEFNRLIADEAKLRECLDLLYEEALSHTRGLLYRFVRSEQFQQVLLLTSPGLSVFTPADPVAPAVRNSHIRQREMSWISFLQRLATKNETISFFGPCAWGGFDSSDVSAASVTLDDNLIAERLVYVERWVCESLGAVMSADPELWPLLRLELSGDLVIQGTHGILLASQTSIELSEEEREFVKNCAGGSQCSKDSPLAEGLINRQILNRRITIPVTRDPLGALERQVAVWPPDHPATQRWQNNLMQLRQLCELMRSSDGLAARRAAMDRIMDLLKSHGVDGQHHSQELYASRLPVNEDCRVAVRKLALGKPVAEQLTREAAPWYDLWRDLAGLYATRLHRAVQEKSRSLGQKRMPLLRFGPALLEAWAQLPELESEIQQAFHAQMGDRLERTRVTLTPDDLSFLRRAFQFRRMKAFDNIAPDFQIIAESAKALSDGRWSLLIAEIHPDFVLWQNCFFAWCPSPDEWAADCAREGGQGPTAVIGRYIPHFGSAHTALGVYPHVPDWNFVGVPAPEGCSSIRPAEVVVEVTEDDILLFHIGGRLLGSVLHTWTTALNTHRLELKGLGPHNPRLYVGRVIVQREGWTVRFDDTLRQATKPGGVAAYRAMRDLRRRYGLPEQVFVRACLPERLTYDKDIKPVFIDFRNPLLVELFAKMAARLDEVSVTEMLPNTQQCWLEGRGGHYSSEFRTVVLASRDSREMDIPVYAAASGVAR